MADSLSDFLSVRYLMLIAVVTGTVAAYLHLHDRLPLFDSTMGGLLVAALCAVTVARRGIWAEEWRDWRDAWRRRQG